MSEINMYQNFFNTLWEFIGGKEDKDNFIQKTLKVCKVFQVKPLKTPRPDVPSQKTEYNLFCKDIQKIKKELQDVPVFKASAIISEECKKVKTSDKKMKSTETFMKKRGDDMKRACRDIKKIIWMKWRLSTSTKATRPERLHSLKKHQSHLNLLKQMTQAMMNRSLKKHQGQAMEKGPLQKQEKKLKMSNSPTSIQKKGGKGSFYRETTCRPQIIICCII